MVEPIEVRAEPTPNPNAMKFSVNRTVSEGRSQTYDSPQAAEASPLARKLFRIGGVRSLFFLGNFITVTRQPGADWSAIAPEVGECIREHFSQSG